MKRLDPTRRGAPRLDRRSGQAAILVILSMSLVLIGTIGFAIDGGQMYTQRQMAQAAADAAAQAGIMSILRGTNATASNTFATGSTPIASYTCTTTDGTTPCVYARDNGFGGTSADTVTLSYPASVSGATLSPSATVPAIQVTVQRTLQNSFIRFLGGPSTTTISAKGIAGIVGIVSPNSVFLLDTSAKDALNISGAAILTVSGGGVAVNSGNSEAAILSGSGQVKASAFTSVGGVSISGGASSTPAPSTGKAAVADPFASLPAPTVGSCTDFPTQYTPPNGTTLYPDTYCGGIVVNGANSVTFSAGTYIIKGGGVTFGNSGVVSGSGVMFYLTGTNSSYGSLTVSGAAVVTLSAQTTGTYQGVLFYQDRSITSSQAATFSGSAAISFTGSLYFPTTSVNFSGASTGNSTMAIIADTLTLSGSANLTYDPTGAKTGLYTSKGVALVQ